MVGHTFTDRRNVNMQTNTESAQEREIRNNVFTLYRDTKNFSSFGSLGFGVLGKQPQHQPEDQSDRAKHYTKAFLGFR